MKYLFTLVMLIAIVFILPLNTVAKVIVEPFNPFNMETAYMIYTYPSPFATGKFLGNFPVAEEASAQKNFDIYVDNLNFDFDNDEIACNFCTMEIHDHSVFRKSNKSSTRIIYAIIPSAYNFLEFEKPLYHLRC